MGYPPGESETGNCEREGRAVVEDGGRSMWIPIRLGEPFRVRLLEVGGDEIPPSEYVVEVEEKPGLFGTQYDYFRVMNHSGRTWQGVRFIAETIG